MVEVGLGGRLDSTNVVEPIVAGITKIARDHMKYLGESLEEIAAEKAGIAKPGVPLVVGETDPHLVEVLRQAADRTVAAMVPEQRALLRVVPPEARWDGRAGPCRTTSAAERGGGRCGA